MRSCSFQRKLIGVLALPIQIERRLATLVLMIGVVLIVFGVTGSDPVEANRSVVPIGLDTAKEPSVRNVVSAIAPARRNPAESSTVAPEHAQWNHQSVRRGDNLSLIFARAGVQRHELQRILDMTKDSGSLRSIFPGQTISFLVDQRGELQGLRLQKSPLESTIYKRTAFGFTADDEIREPDTCHAFRHAELKTSLFDAGQAAGISARMLLELATVFGGVIDFVLDPRKGDTFSVIFEERYLDGEKVGEGDIVAAEFVNAGRRYSAFRYVDTEGHRGYYNEHGVSMRRAFLRAPLDFTRVSSNFNMRRFHPIMKVIRPHRGIDYAAPTGTPVFASGDGRVVESGYSRSNGNYVTIQHGKEFTTRYLHLHKRLAVAGQRVAQGEAIGKVGATGMATGPHLHYEFLVKGVHRNPGTVLDSLPRISHLSKAELQRYEQSTGQVKSQISTYRRAWTVAVNSRDQLND